MQLNDAELKLAEGQINGHNINRRFLSESENIEC